MENQLIVYTPKKNVKKIILGIFLGILVSFFIFTISAIGSTAVCLNLKCNEQVVKSTEKNAF